MERCTRGINRAIAGCATTGQHAVDDMPPPISIQNSLAMTVKEIPDPRPTGILVEVKGGGSLRREEALMATLAERRGVPVFRASKTQVERAKLQLTPGLVAVGSVPFVRQALRQLGKSLPEHSPYPPALAHLLHRNVRKLGSLSEAKSLLYDGRRFFIKPADGWKRFTGFVAEFGDDYRFNGASGAKPVWVSDVVRFVSEWRAYVANGRVLDVRFADHGGDRSIAPDLAVIEGAVIALSTRAAAAAGYVIDFGVLDTGETVLIELNDGFSVAAYDGVPPEVYWAVTVRRWQQMVGQASAICDAEPIIGGCQERENVHG